MKLWMKTDGAVVDDANTGCRIKLVVEVVERGISRRHWGAFGSTALVWFRPIKVPTLSVDLI
jgi:hypothetical protein